MRQPKPILDIPTPDRPREKLVQKGPHALSDLELLAVVLGKGARGISLWRLARLALETIDAAPEPLRLERLREIPGIGTARAAQLLAALEFCRRRIHPAGFRIMEPTDILPLIRIYADRRQEHLLCISLNGANEVLAIRVVTVGLANRGLIHPREVFADPLTDRAAGIILAHNHPAGTIEASSADHEITRRLNAAAAVLGIHLFDHIIFNHRDHFSFAAHGLL